MLEYSNAVGALSIKKIPFFPLVQPVRFGTDPEDAIEEMEVIFEGRATLEEYQSSIKFEPLHQCHETHFNHFPALLNEDGSPWILGNLYLMSLATSYPQPHHNTLYKTAQALKDHAKVLEENGIGVFDFPSRQAKRATYAYRNHWKRIVDEEPDKEDGANEKIIKVIGFYRWAESNRFFTPERPMWIETKCSKPLTDGRGRTFIKEYVKTDLAVKSSGVRSPKKLKPYGDIAQAAIIQALKEIDNTEMNLVFILSLTTAARKQTVLTLKKSAFDSFNGQAEFKLRVGKRGAADTKKQKSFDIFIPGWLAQDIVDYLKSKRYADRLALSSEGQDKDYVFLSKIGQPYYARKDDSMLDQYNAIPVGKAIDAFIRQQLTPHLKSMGHELHIRFHNLRATYANNFVRGNLDLVNSGQMTMAKLIYEVMEKLGQSSYEQAEKYIGKIQMDELSYIAQSRIESRLEHVLAGGDVGEE
ncbi:site-specific integrase [Pseudomonas sp. N40(2020)]|uniref:site-specific integrase n=1 Tax=Pseudomonas sp. N40(2020) TaxID=2767798 RepID=UPI00165707E5|nr:site-specific integrase [Pseudomonas sp. N40(2020)]MBC8997818.1 site-specific integrase [Pseudomonas sp. N40(2020)]